MLTNRKCLQVKKTSEEYLPAPPQKKGGTGEYMGEGEGGGIKEEKINSIGKETNVKY